MEASYSSAHPTLIRYLVTKLPLHKTLKVHPLIHPLNPTGVHTNDCHMNTMALCMSTIYNTHCH